MNIEIGSIGLAKSGRTTVFNALTRGEIDAGSHAKDGSASHVEVAEVVEPRLQILADILQPKRVVPVSAKYTAVLRLMSWSRTGVSEVSC